MELIALWHMAWRRWWLVLLPALVVLVVTLPSLGDVLAPPATYQVQMRLTAAPPPQADAGDLPTPYEDSVYVPLLASEYVVLNMPYWITSDSFAADVSAVLAEQDSPIAADDLIGAFRADGFHSILTLYVMWDDSEQIVSITEAAVTVLQTHNQTYFPQFAAQPVQVVPLDDMSVDEVPPPIMTRLAPLLRIALGLFAGVGLALLAEYLDDRLHTRADVEQIGLSVLGEIPRE